MKTEQMIEMKPQHTSFFIKPPDPGARLRRLPLAALTLIFVSALSLSGCPGSDSSSDPGDTSLPVFQSAMVIGATLTITFNETLGNVPSDSPELQMRFLVMVGPAGTAVRRNVNSVSDTISGDSTLELTLAMPVVTGDRVTLAYTAGTALPISDVAGNPLADFGPEDVRNPTPLPGDTDAPVFQSAMVNGDTLAVTFNENLNFPLPAGLEADFTVRVTPTGGTGAARAVDSVSDGTLGDPMIELTLESAVIDTDGVTVEYTADNSRRITDLSGNILASFAAQTVQNNTDDTDGDGVSNTMDVDDDGDGLIEIHDLNMLNNVRNKLNGTAYNDGSSDNSTGCGGLNGVTTCSGYELTRNLDFSAADSYADNMINAAWRPTGSDPATATNPGWMPIGNNSDDSDNTRFTATFEGNGYSISSLYVRVEPSGLVYAGLFGYLGSSAVARNTGVVAAAVFASSTSTSTSFAYAGGLVGLNSGSISNSYATGSVFAFSTSTASVASSFAYAGGLVGWNEGGSISNSYATGSVSASSGDDVRAGGLVGWNEGGSISNSYATGSASASASSDAYAGGLVGENNRGSISNSYATGSVSAFASSGVAYAGGLVGWNDTGSISNSYATGSASTSTATSFAYAGGLVGNNSGGSISNSYATGSVSASALGTTARAGGLVGFNDGSISNSYWDRGTVVLIEDGAIVSAEDQDIGNTGDHTGVTALTSNRMQATSGTSGTYPDMLGADFNLGTSSEYPLLEYGGTEGTDCKNSGDADLPVCGTLLPGQAVRMASGFLRFSNTAIGRPSVADPMFFYDIGDAATIAISGTGVSGTTAGSYAIEDAVGTAPTVTGTTISGLGALSAGDEFYLRVTFTKGSDSFTQRYRFKK